MQRPSWVDFDERLVAEFEWRSPAIELAAVLERHRSDLDAAARASVEGRAHSLRALAEQAVLAVELEKLLEAGRGAPGVARLVALKDRMLSEISASGLEVVRLRGATAEAVADLAEIEEWRYGDAFARAVVIEELEVAVRHRGEPLRLGRVVVGAPRRDAHRERAQPPARPADAGDRVRSLAARFHRQGRRIVCPVLACGAENLAGADVCVACLTDLASFTRVTLFPDVLFNRGLQASRDGDWRRARDCFAAVALWHPADLESHNAYALACLECEDRAAARRAWETVLERDPSDPLAARGLTVLDAAEARPHQ